jgi:hypothetical protein
MQCDRLPLCHRRLTLQPTLRPTAPQDFFDKVMTSRGEWLYASGPVEEFLSPEDEAMGMPWARNLFVGAPGDAERQVRHDY